jgi:hypothetical protein
MFFCPNCNNSLSITQSSQGTQDQSSNLAAPENTPDVSATTNNSPQEPKKGDQESKLSIGSNKAYFRCSNCGYTDEIGLGTLILSRAPEKSTSDYITDKSKYKDMVYDMTLPHTRNYVCPNKLCKSHSDHQFREAVWFKPNRGSYSVVYICKACQSVW